MGRGYAASGVPLGLRMGSARRWVLAWSVSQSMRRRPPEAWCCSPQAVRSSRQARQLQRLVRRRFAVPIKPLQN